MTELLISFTVSVITSTFWLIILTCRTNRLRNDVDTLAINYAMMQKHRSGSIINTNKVIAALRASEAIRRYETKA